MKHTKNSGKKYVLTSNETYMSDCVTDKDRMSGVSKQLLNALRGTGINFEINFNE